MILDAHKNDQTFLSTYSWSCPIDLKYNHMVRQNETIQYEVQVSMGPYL
jgi:hypothetical protein